MIDAVGDYLESQGIARSVTYYQDAPPAEPETPAEPIKIEVGQIWADTSSEPYVYYSWDGTKWAPLGPQDAVLHVAFLDAEPVTVVAVLDSGGWEPEIDWPKDQPTCQVRTRAYDYTTAHDLAWAVHDLLHSKSNLPLGDDFRVLFSNAMQAPMYIGRNAEGHSEFSVNFEFQLVRLG